MKQTNTLRRTCLLVLAVGLLFPFITLPFMGIDILIDAVGFLVVFNAVRILRRLDGRYRAAVPAALALVPVCALQLFFTTGLFATALEGLRYFGEMAFYFSLCYSLTITARQKGKHLLAAVLIGAALANLLLLLFQLVLLPLNLLVLPFVWLALFAHLLLLVALVYAALRLPA